MATRARLPFLSLALLVCWPLGAAADDDWMVSLEAPGAVPVTLPQRDRFGAGGMPSIAAFAKTSHSVALGLRLRGGLLSDGPAPADDSLMDPGLGSFFGITGGVRASPLAGSGLWLDLSAGAALTGARTRPTLEAGAGWSTRVGPVDLGPSLRYLHVVQPNDRFDGGDAGLALVGLEVALSPGRERTLPRRLISAERPIPPPPPMPPDAGELPPPLEVVLAEGGIQVVEDRIILEEHVLFDTSRSRVKHAGRWVLRAVLELWSRHPEWSALIVEGHADQRGPKDFNDWLSMRRAQRTRDWMVRLGADPDRLQVKWYGESRPRHFGSSDRILQRNRRVELVIVRKQEKPL